MNLGKASQMITTKSFPQIFEELRQKSKRPHLEYISFRAISAVRRSKGRLRLMEVEVPIGNGQIYSFFTVYQEAAYQEPGTRKALATPSRSDQFYSALVSFLSLACVREKAPVDATTKKLFEDTIMKFIVLEPPECEEFLLLASRIE